jgi:hypothetical protein
MLESLSRRANGGRRREPYDASEAPMAAGRNASVRSLGRIWYKFSPPGMTKKNRSLYIMDTCLGRPEGNKRTE